MKEGGRRLLVVPPHLGYGRFSTPPNMVRRSDDSVSLPHVEGMHGRLVS